MMQKGYSLIELMVVIAVIGILTGVAIPNYKNYTIRANVLELFTLAQSTKLAVTEALIANTPTDSLNNQTLGLSQNKPSGKIQDISITNGIIIITGHSKKLGLSNNQTLKITLAPVFEENSIHWQCSTTPEFKHYMPANCR